MDPLAKKYYKIREVSEMLRLPASTLRFWEQEFKELRPKRNAGGSRFYSANDLERIRMIAYLVRDKGLRLEAARQELRANPDGVLRRAQAIESLKSVRQRLQNLIAALDSLR